MKEDCGCTNQNLCDHGKLGWFTEPDRSVASLPPPRSKHEYPSFVREPGIGLPPKSPERPPTPAVGNTPVPTEEQALAALQRYRECPTPTDNELVQRWIAAEKDNPVEHARRIQLTK